MASCVSAFAENFNSRPSARGDLIVCDDVVNLNISIHAPPRGATRQRKSKKRMEVFQFTPLREGRLDFFVVLESPMQFQFTPLREGRRKRISVTLGMKEFQFTPLREGRR